EDAENVPGLCRFIERRLQASEAGERGFNAELNVAVTAAHRRLAGRLPALYSPKVFAFMPFDFVFALLPPHRLAGPAAADLLEPVYAGATMPGVIGCVVVPSRRTVSFNFAIEENRMADVMRLDRLLAALAPDVAAPDAAAADRPDLAVNAFLTAAIDRSAGSDSIATGGLRGEPE
ncbi:MAG TPA: hypothetical protein VFO41_16155, partial [Alphaproteobacteria bacterium]|nr:hypothetical protein [Alphaproteobacteria bacterium]